MNLLSLPLVKELRKLPSSAFYSALSSITSGLDHITSYSPLCSSDILVFAQNLI